MGKTLLPGAGRLTIPQLESEAALDAVNMCRIIKQEIDLNDWSCILWSNSIIMLQSLNVKQKIPNVF